MVNLTTAPFSTGFTHIRQSLLRNPTHWAKAPDTSELPRDFSIKGDVVKSTIERRIFHISIAPVLPHSFINHPKMVAPVNTKATKAAQPTAHGG